MSKSALTNLAAAAVVGVGLALPAGFARDAVLATGLFSLSGALTNWIAVHMLFERVPGLYGSGIIPNRFEEFKRGIRALILENFFSEENFARLAREAGHDLDVSAIADRIEYGELFDGLTEAVTQSPLGGMLSMVGGTAVIEKMRGPVERELRKRVTGILGRTNLEEVLEEGLSPAALRARVETLVDRRLAELTPKKVKEIVQEMIREHLGWLVVWGGVFGAILGLGSSFLL